MGFLYAYVTYVTVTIFSLPETRCNFRQNFWEKNSLNGSVNSGIVRLVCVIVIP